VDGIRAIYIIRILNHTNNSYDRNYSSNNYLDTEYDPEAVFVRCINDQQSIIGAYAYLMGMYPDTLQGITLESDVEAISSVPVTDLDVNQVRGNIGLDSPRKTTQQARIFPGNPDVLFLTQLSETYPGATHKIDQQLYDAKVNYEETHGTKFYEDFAKAVHKPVDNINFYSVFRYADDILTTRANGRPSAVNLSKDLMTELSAYYGHYFGNGVFRDEALTRAFAHPFLSSVAHELQLKMEDDQTGKWAGNGIHEAKHSVYLSNHLTLLASLQLFNEVEDYHVDFNDELRFQLFKQNGKYMVRTLLNDKPLRLEGTANGDGEAEWSAWRDYICSKLYYGNTNKVRQGSETPAEHVRLRDSCANFIGSSEYVNDKVLLKKHDRAPMIPDEPTPVPVVEEEPRKEPSPSILINNMDEGVRSQSVDINAGRTSQVVQYGWYKPTKLTQTQWQEFDIPMKKSFEFNTLSKQDVVLNQFKKIQIEKTTNTPINLAERHDFNFGHDLLKTREVTFNNVDLVKVPQLTESDIYLADKHKFNWGENPSLTNKHLKFNYHYKVKIPQTTTTAFAIPERHTFNYNTNSLDVKKVNFDHIKSVRVKQAESYDVDLANFRFDSLNQQNRHQANAATTIDTQFQNKPVPTIDQKQPQDGSKVSIGGNVQTKPTYSAPIRIKQQYNPYGVKTTADQDYNNQGSLKPTQEPEEKVPEYSPPTQTTDRGDQYPKYTEARSYPAYNAQPKQPTQGSTQGPSSSSTSIPSSGSAYPSSSYPTATGRSSGGVRSYPTYSGATRTTSGNRVYGYPTGRY
jgi:hypothetical protein